jgi:hypothetical protein
MRAYAPTAGVPAATIAPRQPVVQRRAPPLVMHHRRPGESLSYANTHPSLLLCHDTDLYLLIGVEPHLPRRP